MKKRYLLRAILAILFVAGAAYQPVFGQNARVQLVHASPDPAVASVDVYLDNVMWLDNFLYKGATPFTDISAGDHTMAIAPASSSSADGALKTFDISLEDGKVYYMIAAGVYDPALFPENPDGRDTSLQLFVTDDARETSTVPGGFQVRMFHGVLNGPAVDFRVPELGGLLLRNDQSFGAYSGYDGTTPQKFAGEIYYSGELTKIFSVNGDFTGLQNVAFLEMPIGFFSSLELEWMWVLPDGSVSFVAVTWIDTDTDDSPGALPAAFQLTGNYPNPFNPVTTVQFDLPQLAHVRLEVFDLLGRSVLSMPEQVIPAGAMRSIQVDATSLATGLYLYRITARAATTTYVDGGQMVLLK